MRALIPHADSVDLAEAYAVAPRGTRQVRVNMAATLDGAAELNGVSADISGPADKEVFGVLRSLCDVVLVGQQTAMSEGYKAAKPRADGSAPPIAIVARKMRMDPESPFFTEAQAKPILLVADHTGSGAYDADVVLSGDLGESLERLAARGLTRVLCEGGPRITRDLLDAGLVDEFCLTMSPMLAGSETARIVGGEALSAPARFALAHLLEQDDFLFARYRRA